MRRRSPYSNEKITLLCALSRGSEHRGGQSLHSNPPRGCNRVDERLIPRCNREGPRHPLGTPWWARGGAPIASMSLPRRQESALQIAHLLRDGLHFMTEHANNRENPKCAMLLS